ncbi:hypothetical protein Z043_119888 [Scleropages formosus]|uniref:FCP1 homology domain-containing protein n=1 Tax=Scleropages formosus TaxID=113540 RepID=A0A0N8JWV1_SCLFO|nr:hypothetical protein Z043_119888 [Scleropages formosus]
MLLMVFFTSPATNQIPPARDEHIGLRQEMRGDRLRRNPGAQLVQEGQVQFYRELKTSSTVRVMFRDLVDRFLKRALPVQAYFPKSAVGTERGRAPISNADFIVPVEIDGTVHQVYVLKRPHVDEFLQKMGELFECVLFTASLAKYADPVADLLDQWGVFRARLFRESCVFHRGNYVKDLSRLGRELSSVIIVDNSPASYIFHPENAVPVQSWFDDMTDTELLDLLPFFEGLSREQDVYSVLQNLRSR